MWRAYAKWLWCCAGSDARTPNDRGPGTSATCVRLDVSCLLVHAYDGPNGRAPPAGTCVRVADGRALPAASGVRLAEWACPAGRDVRTYDGSAAPKPTNLSRRSDVRDYPRLPVANRRMHDPDSGEFPTQRGHFRGGARRKVRARRAADGRGSPRGSCLGASHAATPRRRPRAAESAWRHARTARARR